METSQRSLVAHRCRRDRAQAEDNGRKSIGKPRGQAGNCAPRGLTENAPVERFHSPIAGGLQPAGKGRAPSPTAVIRPRLPGAGAESRLPGGRQARSDLSTDKSDKKERAHHATTKSSEPHHALVAVILTPSSRETAADGRDCNRNLCENGSVKQCGRPARVRDAGAISPGQESHIP